MAKERKMEKLSDMVGAWKMTDEEVDDFMRDLRKGWKRWTKKLL